MPEDVLGVLRRIGNRAIRRHHGSITSIDRFEHRAEDSHVQGYPHPDHRADSQGAEARSEVGVAEGSHSLATREHDLARGGCDLLHDRGIGSLSAEFARAPNSFREGSRRAAGFVQAMVGRAIENFDASLPGRLEESGDIREKRGFPGGGRQAGQHARRPEHILLTLEDDQRAVRRFQKRSHIDGHWAIIVRMAGCQCPDQAISRILRPASLRIRGLEIVPWGVAARG